jgi:transcriptional regulator with XRE-family HTH domain
MNVTEASSSGDTDVGDRRVHADYLMKIGMRLKAGELTEAEAAKKLGLSADELTEVLSGKSSELTVTKIWKYLDLQQTERQ